MGILNVTPDSFSDGGLYYQTETAIARGLELEEEGVDILDIGGESSRPGAGEISEEEERSRIVPVIESLAHRLHIPLSIDTYKSRIAKAALAAGASMINDISGARFDPEMAKLAVRHNVPIVIMHMQGTPNTMQIEPVYDNVISDIIQYFQERCATLERLGMQADQIILDPGIGFGKTVEHNYLILKHLGRFAALGFPLLIGPSRKSFLGTTLHLPFDHLIEGTAAAVTAAILHGAAIVRVHDVKEMVRTVRIADAIMRAEGS